MERNDPFRLSGTILRENFEVREVIAEGGFGVVYRGWQVSLDRPVALKVLKRQSDDAVWWEKFLGMFRQEAKFLARIDHPAIVKIIEFGVSPMPQGVEAPWMALEWLEGRTLEDDLSLRETPYSVRECFDLLRPTLRALSRVHEARIAHRDLKPANLMVVQDHDGNRIAKLMDFGIAKELPADQAVLTSVKRTQIGGIRAMTAGYAAPEQFQELRTGPWTDVYSLGLVLTEMLTRQSPYDAQGAHALMFHACLSPERPTPARRGINVGAWEPILARATAIDPVARYQHAGELLEALETGLGGAVSAVAQPHVPAPQPRTIQPTQALSEPPPRVILSTEPMTAPTVPVPSLQATIPDDDVMLSLQKLIEIEEERSALVEQRKRDEAQRQAVVPAVTAREEKKKPDLRARLKRTLEPPQSAPVVAEKPSPLRALDEIGIPDWARAAEQEALRNQEFVRQQMQERADAEAAQRRRDEASAQEAPRKPNLKERLARLRAEPSDPPPVINEQLADADTVRKALPTLVFEWLRPEGGKVTQRLCQDVIKVGRDARAHLLLDHPAIARLHAVIECKHDDVSVIDLGSVTMLNGLSINKASLSSGDLLQFGPVVVRVKIER